MEISNLALLIITLFLGSCSNDDSPKPSCFQNENRKAVAKFNNVEGHVQAPNPQQCPTIYTLTGGPNPSERKLALLAPCNLSSVFEQDGLKVVYSGFLYETFETEDVCAQKFEIIEISRFE